MSEQNVKRSLKSNFIYNFISQILTLIVPLVTTPYLSRVLHEVGNGQCSYAMSIITYFILFSNLGFDMYGQRQIASCRDNPQEKSKVFWELFILKSIFTSVALAVLYSVVFTVGFGENYNLLILFYSLQVITIPFDIQFFFRGEENFRSIAIRTIIMKIIGLVLIFLLVKTENDTWIYALCLSGSIVFSNLIMWPSLIGKIKFVKPNALKLLRHLKPAFLIFLPTLAVTIYSVFDKTMIGLLAENPDYENGCYEQAYKINSVALLFVTIITSVMVSRNSYDYNAGNTEGLKNHISQAIRYVWMMGTPLIFGFAVLSSNLSSWFLGGGYAEVPILMQIMSVRFIISGFGDVFGSQLFLAINKEKYSTVATFMGAGINILLNYFLIKQFGALGAAISTAVCEFTVTGILVILALRKGHIKLRMLFEGCWKYILAGTVMFGVIFVMQRYMSYAVWTFFVITLVGCMVYALMLFVLRDKFFLYAVKSGFGMVKGIFKKSSKGKTATDIIGNMDYTENDNQSDIDKS